LGRYRLHRDFGRHGLTSKCRFGESTVARPTRGLGQELSPQEVVERVCRDVRDRGLAAVLDYSARIDKAELTAETIRVEQATLEKAHWQAEPAFLETMSASSARRAAISNSATSRSRAWASACPAAPRPIRRPC
jgi:histidinol dehydrogenase